MLKIKPCSHEYLKAAEFFNTQTFTGIAIDTDSDEVVGLYILHPNNAVVATNTSALNLYKKLGFTQLGVIPNGFLMKDGHYEDIIPHYIEL